MSKIISVFILYLSITSIGSPLLGSQTLPSENQITGSNSGKISTKTLRFRYLEPQQIREKIKGMLSKEGSMEIFQFQKDNKKVNVLVIRDHPARIEAISKAIQEWDKSLEPVLVTLSFSEAPLNSVLNAISKVTDLNIVGGEGLTQSVTTYLTDVPLQEALKVILKAAGYTFEKEENIIRLIPLKESPLSTEVFRLKFASAQKVKDAIEDLLSDRGKIEVFSKFDDEDSPDTLVVTDTPEALNILRRVIEKLDIKAQQVMIEAKFVEVSLTKDFKFGIDWLLKGGISAGASGATTFPLGRGGRRIPEHPEDTATTGGSNIFTMGNITFSDFKAMFESIDDVENVKIISNPRILTREGEEAQIIVGSRVPIPIYNIDQDTGRLVVSGYEEEDIGIILRVTPYINADNTITVKLNPEISERTGWTGPNNERPIISTRQITTVATVKDGQSIVLGGLITEKDYERIKKVPFLGDIPILGAFFKHTERGDPENPVRRELLIFLTPRIVGNEGTKISSVSFPKRKP